MQSGSVHLRLQPGADAMSVTTSLNPRYGAGNVATHPLRPLVTARAFRAKMRRDGVQQCWGRADGDMHPHDAWAADRIGEPQLGVITPNTGSRLGARTSEAAWNGTVSCDRHGSHAVSWGLWTVQVPRSASICPKIGWTGGGKALGQAQTNRDALTGPYCRPGASPSALSLRRSLTRVRSTSRRFR